MGIREIIQKWRNRRAESGEMYKEYAARRRIEKILEEREKSSEERELEKFIEEKRQERIKKALVGLRKNKSKNFFPGKFLFRHENAFKNKESMLKQTNLFKDKKCMFTKEKYLFK